MPKSSTCREGMGKVGKSQRCFPKEGKLMAATIAEVAAAAGVSTGTVSKALNGTGRISAETRTRVVEAAEQLGFTARGRNADSRAAGDLAYSVGVLTSDSFGRFTIPIMLGAEDTLGPGRVSVLMCDSRGDALRERFYVDSLIRRRVDGIIVTGRSNDPRPPIADAGAIPVIYAYAPSTNPEDTSIVPNNNRVGAMVVSHLLGTGRSKIVHITGPENQTAANDRERGALDALALANLSWASVPLHGEWSERWGREAAIRLLRDGVNFDGAFCGSDQIARGFATGLREANVSVPSSVGVVGVDNWEVMAEASRPPLTTVDLNQSELGSVAAGMIIDAIGGVPLRRGLTRIEPRLVMRESTASVPLVTIGLA
jgi:LacI family transcriptional regulator